MGSEPDQTGGDLEFGWSWLFGKIHKA